MVKFLWVVSVLKLVFLVWFVLLLFVLCRLKISGRCVWLLVDGGMKSW